ncbi:putative RNA helicase/RNAse III [Aspergillus lucknowensis]|uniref:Dicer-like protein 2 n=1 Tax=Aspergillus lucknowensis TaxID=176173 RepID=A0ABR4LWQ6_9EURO
MASISSGEPELPVSRARNYQLEMFEASLKDNIIVAMGTGSGKTHIALLRIIHELENAGPGKLIWFLAPTVALCLQQHKVISHHIPAAKSRTLTGLDKVELWTEQAVWDAVLQDVQVVISTHAVLVDAMTHGFVRISRLGLMIFDEAHHCVRKHPANKIMQDFYRPALAKFGPDAVPRILGLTASAGSSREELLTIESNLDSFCTTPQVHRHELLENTHKPELRRVLFTPEVIEDALIWGSMRRALMKVWMSLDIEDDPYVKKLRRNSPLGLALQKVFLTEKTYCREQLKRLVDRADHIFVELGPWAADYFIWASIEQLRGRSLDSSIVLNLDNEERSYLVNILSQIPVPEFNLFSTDTADFPVSPKFKALISFLRSTAERDFSGLIFVQQRATVAAMSQLLSVHPSTRDRFQTGGFIGMANSANRKNMLGDLLTVKMQRHTLDEFRNGRRNLIVATDALEEGIDVSACSVVVCYNRPPNLKSFVQRRGRARRQHSTYAILLSTDDDNSHLEKWHVLEKVMEEAYQDDQRRLEELRSLETTDEDVSCRYCVESTGAILTADNAMQHLHHFCSTLPREPYIDNRPEFSFDRNDFGLLKGKVTLPSCVHPNVRRAEGDSWWLTERAAKKEAAFQAYKALYENGLLNENLLPLTKSREFTQKDLALLPAINEVSEQYDPWVDWASSWSSPEMHQSRIIIRRNGDEKYMKLITPTMPPLLESMALFWDSETTYAVEFEAAEPITTLAAENVESMRGVTALYLQASTTRINGTGQDFVALFSPDVPHDELVPWLHEYLGYESALDVFSSQRSLDLMGVVRDRSHYGELLLFERWVVSDTSDLGVELECTTYPRRKNLLQQQILATKRPADDELESRTKKRVSASQCTIDKLPAPEAVFGRFIAVILNRLEAALVAIRLCETILRDIDFHDIQHVITAITMPSAQAPSHYQRYEFFGDSVLKFISSFSLYYRHPTWHEGYLSEGRDAIIQNPRLARAALDCGLDAFIISKMFSPRKWSAPLISEKLQDVTSGKRELSTKVLADVVEALIGAAYIDGGFENAQACLRRFLPELEIITPDIGLSRDSGPQYPHLIQYETLEENIGYTFNNKALLVEALTHPSCQHDTAVQSYQRLEFLGDAVLDMIIVDLMLRHPAKVSQGDMTRIKHALVNANLLAFFCMELSWTLPVTEVTIAPNTTNNNRTNSLMSPTQPIQITTTTAHAKQMHLYTHLRHSPSTRLFNNTPANANTLSRHKSLRSTILSHITSPSPSQAPSAAATATPNATTYPWLTLSQLTPEKFLSDIIESTLGAIFVDSGGNLTSCSTFLERLGLLPYARRILSEGIDVVHPMQRAQWMAGSDGIRFCTVRVLDPHSGEGVRRDGGGDGNEDGEGGEIGGSGATYTCTVSTNGTGDNGLGGIVVEGCLSGEEAEIRAAELVIEKLSSRGRDREENEGDDDAMEL